MNKQLYQESYYFAGSLILSFVESWLEKWMFLFTMLTIFYCRKFLWKNKQRCLVEIGTDISKVFLFRTETFVHLFSNEIGLEIIILNAIGLFKWKKNLPDLIEFRGSTLIFQGVHRTQKTWNLYLATHLEIRYCNVGLGFGP